MHLHWKYRELVKIISNEKSIAAVQQVAQILEAESGGILVAVERVSKGYAIIVYRGKNYSRPESLRPQTLLNKRQAMKRSIEAQRRESLKLHVLRLNDNIDELKLRLVKDKESDNLHLVNESRIQLARDKLKAHVTPINLDDGMASVVNDQLATKQDKAISFSLICWEDENGKVEPVSANKPVTNEIHANLLEDVNGEVGASVSTPCPEDAVHPVSENGARDSSSRYGNSESEPSNPVMVSKISNDRPSRAVHLSNGERLLLRKQALKMKKRPVLAVGRNNIVTGIAKTIKTHFEKHPLAIVNVKGRAKGTSVREVVFKLEQATGAVLVSQEPSNVILYRGWGAGDNPGHNNKNRSNMGKKDYSQGAVSPELLAAIRLECGFKSHGKEDATA